MLMCLDDFSPAGTRPTVRRVGLSLPRRSAQVSAHVTRSRRDEDGARVPASAPALITVEACSRKFTKSAFATKSSLHYDNAPTLSTKRFIVEEQIRGSVVDCMLQCMFQTRGRKASVCLRHVKLAKMDGDCPTSVQDDCDRERQRTFA
ncbi:hypothetical protein EVAR_19918_1 [Eumeta japonica]|uniref:Uncharacterized protein n=1 Tax=Eumeta variegata TaxID=151549 RepID=A0A4C1ZM97_EUMVA|nr:hypothetical protein EVAR_19918_1 [Eumeta japonica]